MDQTLRHNENPALLSKEKNNPQKYFPNWATWGRTCQGWNPSRWLLALSAWSHMGVVLCGVLLGFLWFWILHMLVGSREGSPHASESSSLPWLVICPTVCGGMINEQVLMCGSDSAVARGQADIYRGAQTARRLRGGNPPAFWEFKHNLQRLHWRSALGADGVWRIGIISKWKTSHPSLQRLTVILNFCTVSGRKVITLPLIVYVILC